MCRVFFAIVVLISGFGFLLSSCGTGPMTKGFITNKGAYAVEFPDPNPLSKYINAGKGESMADTDITVEAWIKTNGGDSPIFARSVAVLGVDAAGLATFTVGGGVTVTSTTIVNDNSWHHVAGVLVGEIHSYHPTTTTCTLDAKSWIHIDTYVDGVYEDCAGPLPSYPDPASIDVCMTLSGKLFPCPNIIGRDLIAGGFFAGTIDELRLWREAKTPEQIETWRHREITVENWNQANPNGALIGYWRFNEGTGSIASDSSGYGNSGAKIFVTGTDAEGEEISAPWDGGWVAGYPF